MKLCRDCQQTKPFDEFPSRNSGETIYYEPRCKVCKSIYRRNYYTTHGDKEREQRATRYHFNSEYELQKQRDSRQSNEYRQKATEYVRAWRGANPEKIKAHRQVAIAITKGELIKPGHCQQCQQAKSSRKLHAHHDDYNRPLDVIFLCAWCHRQRHKLYHL